MITNKINKYFPYILIYMCYYTNLPIKLEELTMISFIIWCILEEKIFRFKLNLNLIGLISIFGSVSLIQSYKNNYPIDRVLEQLLIITVMFIGYDLLFKKYGYKKLFRIYLKISYFICLLALLQFVVYFFLKIDILRYPIGCNSRMLPALTANIARVRSIAYEPGWFAQTLIPSVVYSFEVLIKSKRFQKKYIIIITVFFMTMSSGALVIIPIYFILKKIKTIKQIVISIPLLIGATYLTQGVWYSRVQETITNFQSLKTGIFSNINASSFAILSNLYVALNNNNLLLGVGLGNHPYSYFRNFIDRKVGIYHFYGLNAMDGYSLLTRMISEVGIIFCFLFLLFIIRNLYLRDNTRSIINIGAFCGILSYLIRGGLYTRFGTTFIIMLFFYTGKNMKYVKKYNIKKSEVKNGCNNIG
ncbi:hypothetical protein [Candidatus Cetobacterium colombiensis]|uniref:O-antigen ligase domain-containing protein n=1 Tax=Candidatus Cetobacterium colombiensis TaxID=3073100 RepID=A0ABU4WC89_9FUSO|nr:hypothetical protein [Candidatus Cetobacterium colombiensis]MDX8337153.1 hypothetical protein [Candidatus Cetobacterium colombiensis]